MGALLLHVQWVSPGVISPGAYRAGDNCTHPPAAAVAVYQRTANN